MGRPEKYPAEIWMNTELCVKRNWEQIEELEQKIEAQEDRIQELEKSIFDKIKEKLEVRI